MNRQQANNEAFRTLFTLPPINESASTAIAVPEMPEQTVTTGDREVDAVLWLQRVVSTGHQALIDKALEAVKLIKTPMKALQDRYTDHLRRSGAHTFQIAFGTIGFGELEKQAEGAIKKARHQHEALARFGSVQVLMSDTPSEKACRKALRGLKRGVADLYADEQAHERFSRHPVLVPATIEDCLHARSYWNRLYRLRSSAADFGDSSPQGCAHNWYCLAMLANIQPLDAKEAEAAFNHLYESNSANSVDAPAILRNLIVSGWEMRSQAAQNIREEVQA